MEGTAAGRYHGLLAAGYFMRDLARWRKRGRPGRRWDPLMVVLVIGFVLVVLGVGPLLLILLRGL